MGRYDARQNNSARNLVIIGLVVLFAGAGIYFWIQNKGSTEQQQQQQPLSLPEAPPQTEPPVSLGQPLTEPGATADAADAAGKAGAEVNGESEGDELEERPETAEAPAALPALAESDAAFREDLTRLSPGLAPWLQGKDLIGKYLTIVNDFSQGLRIANHLFFLQIEQPFVAQRDDKGLYMAEESYRRYDKLAAAISDLDVRAAIAVYNKYRPLLLEAFQGFGYPQGYQLEDLFKKAADEILGAPVIEGRIALYRPSVRYKYSDPKLEQLNGVQKQMLRMGPKNTKLIQDKVRQLIEALVNQPEGDGVTLG